MTIEKLYGKFLPAPNSSKGFHLILIELIKREMEGGVTFLSEPISTLPHLENVLGKDFSVSCINREENENIDFCVMGSLSHLSEDVMVAQSLIEHTCRPSVLIENMLSGTKIGGAVILQHPYWKFGYHAYPVDCVRMFEDFYIDLQRYLPFVLEKYISVGESVFTVIRRLS